MSERSLTYRYCDWPSVPCRISAPGGDRSAFALPALDSGAAVTVLDARLAICLGIDIEGGGTATVRGFGGRLQGRTATVDVVPLDREELRVRLDAMFVEDVEAEIGSVLGLDYLLAVDVTLSHSRQTVTFRLP